MCPFFSRDALAKCLPTFQENVSGYGVDIVLWPAILGKRGMAIIDAVQVAHRRPLGSAGRRIGNGKTSDQELVELSHRNPTLPRYTGADVPPTILLGMPFAGNPDPYGYALLWTSTSKTASVIRLPKTGLALPHDFNVLWATALNHYDAGKITHFAMLHDDVLPVEGWLDILMLELQRNDADIVASVVAMKDEKGFTSTAIDDPSNPWNPLKRLTMAEVLELPETFSAADCGWPDRALLWNTGCWMADLRRPAFRRKAGQVIEPLAFDTRARIAWNGTNRQVDFQSEDWWFSRRLHELGGKAMATRKTKCRHHGMTTYDSDHVWGTWKEDQCGLAAELRQLCGATRDATVSQIGGQEATVR